MDIKFIIPARPHVFTDGILDPINGHIEKVRRSSKVDEHNLDELG